MRMMTVAMLILDFSQVLAVTERQLNLWMLADGTVAVQCCGDWL